MTKRSREYFRRKKDARDVAWMCRCGHWEESCLHCSVCGSQPPWGCPCELCQYSDDPNYDGTEYAFDDEDDDPDDQPEIAGYGCLVCGSRQENGGTCDNCDSDDLEEIYM